MVSQNINGITKNATPIDIDILMSTINLSLVGCSPAEPMSV